MPAPAFLGVGPSQIIFFYRWADYHDDEDNNFNKKDDYKDTPQKNNINFLHNKNLMVFGSGAMLTSKC